MRIFLPSRDGEGFFMEKYSTTRGQTVDSPNSALADIYRDVAFKRQMTASRVESVRADSKKTEDTPVWRGDHTFSSDAAKYSFLNFIEPDVAQKHPDWSKQKIRKEALAKFQQRLEQDLSYEQKESSHQETAVRWKVVETQNGKQELATEYGGETITLRQLWDHTREYATFVGIPAAYNPDEEKAQYAMEQAFVRGDAQAYISVLSHPDAVRYVQVWEKDSDGGIQSKQIDLYKTTGRDFSHLEGDVLVKHLAAFTENVQGASVVTAESSYAHFIVQSGTLLEQDIRTIAIVQAATLRDSVRIHSVSRINSKEVHEQIFAHTESQNTFADIQLFIASAIDAKIAQLKELEVSQNGKQKQEINKQVIITAETGDKARGETEVVKPANEGSHLSSEGSKNTEVAPIAEVLAELIITKTAVTWGAKLPEISGGALYWLSTLTEKPTQHAFSQQTEKPQTISEAMLSVMRSVRVFFEKGNDAFTKVHRRTSIPQVSDVAPSDKARDALFPSETPKEEINIFELVARQIQESGPAVFFVILQTLTEKMRPSTTSEKTIKQNNLQKLAPFERDDTGKDKEVSTNTAIFGIFYWIFLSYNVDMSASSVHSKEAVVDPLGQDKKIHEEKVVTDQPPWILLSIIWHLTMLREAAMAGHTPQGVQKSAQVVVPTLAPLSTVSVLPTNGVIFPSSFVLE